MHIGSPIAAPEGDNPPLSSTPHPLSAPIYPTGRTGALLGLSRFLRVSFGSKCSHFLVHLLEGSVWNSGPEGLRGGLVKGVEEKRNAGDENFVFVFSLISDSIFRRSIPKSSDFAT